MVLCFLAPHLTVESTRASFLPKKQTVPHIKILSKKKAKTEDLSGFKKMQQHKNSNNTYIFSLFLSFYGMQENEVNIWKH